MLAATLPVGLESTVPLQGHTMNQTPAQTAHVGCLEMELVQVLAMLVPMANIKMRRGKRVVCNARKVNTGSNWEQKYCKMDVRIAPLERMVP